MISAMLPTPVKNGCTAKSCEPSKNMGTASHEISLMCDDLDTTIAELKEKGVVFNGEPIDEGWGITVRMSLPGDVDMLLYQPRHNTAL